MPAGGKIAPDGRPPQAKGVGKDSKRHDLEAPATPGLHGSDLQQGDVQALEQGQKIAPRPKKVQPAAQSKPRPASSKKRATAVDGVPDPIEFAAGRIGGNVVSPDAAPGVGIDPRPWMPLLEQFVARPQVNPKLAALYVQQIASLRRQPFMSNVNYVDMLEADDILEGS